MKKYNIFPIKFLTLSLLALCGLQNCHAQDKKHTFSVLAGGPFSYVEYDLKEGNTDNGNGMLLGFRYSYYLNENWSIGIGAEYQTYNTSAGLGFASGNYMTTDSGGETFEFRYNIDDLREEQSLKYVNIPLNLQYEGDDYPGFYASVGAKAGFALKSTYETSIENLSTSGYYPQYDAELFDPRFMGFGNLGSVSSGKQDLDLNISYIATFEAGIKQFEDEKSAVYIGLYFDYGFNNILKKDNNKQIVEYPDSAPVNLKYNSLLNTSYTSEAKIMAYGIKVRYAIW